MIDSIEVRPAAPIEIPQVEVVLPIPKSWSDFAISRNVDLARGLGNWVTDGWAFVISPSLCDRHCESFLVKEGRCGAEASAALDGEAVHVVMTLSRELWELFTLAASNVGKSCHYVLLVLLADEMSFERKHGAEIRELYAKIGKDAARERAKKPAPAGRVIHGPWELGKKRGAKA